MAKPSVDSLNPYSSQGADDDIALFAAGIYDYGGAVVSVCTSPAVESRSIIGKAPVGVSEVKGNPCRQLSFLYNGFIGILGPEVGFIDEHPVSSGVE
jgi:hypothetical protein